MKTMKGAQNTRLRKRGVAVKRAIASILLSLGMAVGMFAPSLAPVAIAATTSLSINVAASKISASFTYGNGGKVLIVTAYSIEKHTETGQTTNQRQCSGTATGSNTTATCSMTPNTGYEFTQGYATGAVTTSANVVMQTDVTYP